MKKIRLVLAQVNIKDSLDKNFNNIKNILKKYSFLEPDLVVFPEYALSGLMYGKKDKALDQDHKIFKKLGDLSKNYNTYLIPGSFWLKQDKNIYNATCLFDKNGQNLGFYFKRLLWGSENKFLTPGKKVKVYKTDIGNISITICADILEPLYAYDLRLLKFRDSVDIDLVVNISFWSREGQNTLRKKVPRTYIYNEPVKNGISRALEFASFYAFVNYAKVYTLKLKSGKEYKFNSIGQSFLISPYGDVILKSVDNDTSILFYELNFKKTSYY